MVTGWPFFVASPEERIEPALDLAEVGPGMRVCDLGCGDGRLLEATAERGAQVVGIELDAELAATARQRLAAAGVAGEVIVGDLLTGSLPEADVYLAYLSPAMLQELVAGTDLAARGARLVTVTYRVPGLVPNRSVDGCHRHDLPGLVRPVRRGFEAAALLAVVPPGDRRLLAFALAGHPAGAVRLQVSGQLADVLELRVGASTLARRGELAIDLRLTAPPRPGIHTARLELAEVGDLEVVLATAAHKPDWTLVDAPTWGRIAPQIGPGATDGDLAALIAEHR